MAEQAHLKLKQRHWFLIPGLLSLIFTLIGGITWMALTRSLDAPRQASSLSLSVAGTMLRSAAPATPHQVDNQRSTIPDIIGGVNGNQIMLQKNALDIVDATQMDSQVQIDARQCYLDPQARIVASQATNAGDGRLVFSLNYCPNQQALFGRFNFLETSHPLAQGGCFYIQNELIFSGPGGFEGECPQQIAPGSFYTLPAIDDGHNWQACWIDYSVTLPKPLCTAFQRSIQ